MASDTYSPSDFGKKEVALHSKFVLQRDDALNYFKNCVKPRLDMAYKLYMAYNGDRAREIQKWQANVFVPYINAVVETLMPRILDARPDFSVQGRTEEDQIKAEKLQQLTDYTWEMSGMDTTAEDLTRSSLVYGTGFMQVSWRKDVREHSFLSSSDLADGNLTWEKRKETFYDAPYCEWVDNYALMYDWHNVRRESKQYWFKRLLLTEAEIRRKYPLADRRRLKLALARPGGDLEDYGAIRTKLKLTHDRAVKGADWNQLSGGSSDTRYSSSNDPSALFYEVFEWWRPFDDAYSVMVNEVPILKGGQIPIPYDFKEAPFIDVPYFRIPGEFEGIGLPHLLENPQLMLNMIKNQRLDAATMSIHKMWVVSPLANVNKNDLVTRPFGIIWSPDPNGVREVQFTDIKSSAYREEELIKSDMRYASGVDDFSMGAAGGGMSATATRHLRESTLERVRLFVNHLGDAYSDLMRYWISMYRQFYTKEMTIRIVGEDGREMFPLVQKDDLMGMYDFRASVLPSIAGQNDIDKKQGMDLFQLLVQMPFVDPRKLTSKVLRSWNWSLDSLSKKEEEAQVPGMGPEGMMQGQEQVPGGSPADMLPAVQGYGAISPDVAKGALAMLGGTPPQPGNPLSEMGSPVNLLKSGPIPPTAGGANPRGLNRSGGVNTNIPVTRSFGESAEKNLLGRAQNIQR